MYHKVRRLDVYELRFTLYARDVLDLRDTDPQSTHTKWRVEIE